MTTAHRKVAILFPADARELAETRVETSRLADVAAAFASAGVEVVGAPFTDDIVDAVAARLAGVDGVLVWYNPNEAGRDRSVLNGMLRKIAAGGAVVSAHPDAIDRMGTKEVLFRTRSMAWGCDTRRYDSPHAMRSGLLAGLRLGPRVLKQLRGQSGDGVWKVSLAGEAASQARAALSEPASDAMVRVRHAKRGSAGEQMSIDDFVARCRPYFTATGAMIDQPFQHRLREGMVRCYVVGDRVAGFGEQRVNALYPAAEGRPDDDGPPPGPRHYFPPDRADFQRLKSLLERDWIAELCRLVGLSVSDLPVLWDADFLLGPKDEQGADTYVLCEINTSSVYPFPPTALAPLVTETLRRLARRS